MIYISKNETWFKWIVFADQIPIPIPTYSSIVFFTLDCWFHQAVLCRHRGPAELYPPAGRSRLYGQLQLQPGSADGWRPERHGIRVRRLAFLSSSNSCGPNLCKIQLDHIKQNNPFEQC